MTLEDARDMVFEELSQDAERQEHGQPGLLSKQEKWQLVDRYIRIEQALTFQTLLELLAALAQDIEAWGNRAAQRRQR
jgi:hypothetical protein